MKLKSIIINMFIKRGVESLRQPDRSPRCYDLTDEERLNKIKEWNNRNVWNDPVLAHDDQITQLEYNNKYYGA